MPSQRVSWATWAFNALIAGLLASNLGLIWQVRADNRSRDAKMATFEEFKARQERATAENERAHRDFMAKADSLEAALRREQLAWKELKSKLPYAAMADRSRVAR